MSRNQQGLRRVLATTRKLTDARMCLDRLAHRLRADGPAMTRDEIRQQILLATGWLNEIVPRSPFREE